MNLDEWLKSLDEKQQAKSDALVETKPAQQAPSLDEWLKSLGAPAEPTAPRTGDMLMRPLGRTQPTYAAPQERGYLETAAVGLKRGFHSAYGGIGKGLGLVSDVTGIEALKETGERWKEASRKELLREDLQLAKELEGMEWYHPKKILSNLAEAAPLTLGTMGAAMLAGKGLMIGGTAGALALGARSLAMAMPKIAKITAASGTLIPFGLSSGGQMYEELLEAGQDKQTAQALGIAAGVAEGVIEMAGMRKLFDLVGLNTVTKATINKSLTRLAALKAATKDVGVIALIEGAEEVAQGMKDNIIRKGWINPNQKITEGALEQFVLGTIMGAALGGAGKAIGTVVPQPVGTGGVETTDIGKTKIEAPQPEVKADLEISDEDFERNKDIILKKLDYLKTDIALKQDPEYQRLKADLKAEETVAEAYWQIRVDDPKLTHREAMEQVAKEYPNEYVYVTSKLHELINTSIGLWSDADAQFVERMALKQKSPFRDFLTNEEKAFIKNRKKIQDDQAVVDVNMNRLLADTFELTEAVNQELAGERRPEVVESLLRQMDMLDNALTRLANKDMTPDQYDAFVSLWSMKKELDANKGQLQQIATPEQAPFAEREKYVADWEALLKEKGLNSELAVMNTYWKEFQSTGEHKTALANTVIAHPDEFNDVLTRLDNLKAKNMDLWSQSDIDFVKRVALPENAPFKDYFKEEEKEIIRERLMTQEAPTEDVATMPESIEPTAEPTGEVAESIVTTTAEPTGEVAEPTITVPVEPVEALTTEKTPVKPEINAKIAEIKAHYTKLKAELLKSNVDEDVKKKESESLNAEKNIMVEYETIKANNPDASYMEILTEVVKKLPQDYKTVSQRLSHLETNTPKKEWTMQDKAFVERVREVFKYTPKTTRIIPGVKTKTAEIKAEEKPTKSGEAKEIATKEHDKAPKKTAPIPGVKPKETKKEETTSKKEVKKKETKELSLEEAKAKLAKNETVRASTAHGVRTVKSIKTEVKGIMGEGRTIVTFEGGQPNQMVYSEGVITFLQPAMPFVRAKAESLKSQYPSLADKIILTEDAKKPVHYEDGELKISTKADIKEIEEALPAELSNFSFRDVTQSDKLLNDVSIAHKEKVDEAIKELGLNPNSIEDIKTASAYVLSKLEKGDPFVEQAEESIRRSFKQMGMSVTNKQIAQIMSNKPTSQPQSISVQEANQVKDRVTKNWRQYVINIYDNPANMHPSLYDIYIRKPFRAMAYIENGVPKVAIVLKHIENAEQLEATILHEVIGHHGIDALFKDMPTAFTIFNRIFNEPGLKDKIHTTLTKQYGKDYAIHYPTPEMQTAEYLAILAEQNQFNTHTENFFGLIKEALNKKGFLLKMSDVDIANLIIKSRRYVAQIDDGKDQISIGYAAHQRYAISPEDLTQAHLDKKLKSKAAALQALGEGVGKMFDNIGHIAKLFSVPAFVAKKYPLFKNIWKSVVDTNYEAYGMVTKFAEYIPEKELKEITPKLAKLMYDAQEVKAIRYSLPPNALTRVATSKEVEDYLRVKDLLGESPIYPNLGKLAEKGEISIQEADNFLRLDDIVKTWSNDIAELEDTLVTRFGINVNQLKGVRFSEEEGMGKYYTKKELKSMGFSQKEIDLYATLINATMKGAEVYLEKLKWRYGFYGDRLSDINKSALEHVLKHSLRRYGGYFPIMRFGNYWIEFIDTSGVRHVMAFESNADAIAYEKGLYDNMLIAPGTAVKRFDITNTEQIKRAMPAMTVWQLESLVESAGVDKNSPVIQQLREEILSRLSEHRILEREWIPGFFKTPENVHKTIESFLSMSIHGWANAKTHVLFNRYLDEIHDPKLKRYAQTYFNELQALAPDKLSGARTFVYLWMLTGKISFFVQNMTQQTFTFNRLVKETGSYKEAAKLMGEAYRDTFMHFVDRIKYYTTKGPIKPSIDNDLHEAIHRAMDESVLAAQLTETLLSSRIGLKSMTPFTTNLTKLNYLLGGLGIASEKINRTQAFVAGWKYAKQLGLDNEAAYEKAKELSTYTQWDYTPGNMPVAINKIDNFFKMGIGKSAYLFQHFGLNAIHTLAEYFRGTVKGNAGDAKALASSVFTLGTLAGLKGLPLVGLIFLIYTALTDDKPEEDIRSIVGAENRKYADMLLYGPTSYYTGLNFSGLVGLGEYGTSIIAQGLHERIRRGIWAWSIGRKERAIAEMALPDVFRNFVIGREWLEAGYATTLKGHKLVPLTTAETYAKIYGSFTPLSVTLKHEEIATLKHARNVMVDTNKLYNQKLAVAVVANDKERFREILQDIERKNAGQPKDQQIKVNMASVEEMAKRMLGEDEPVELPRQMSERAKHIKSLFGTEVDDSVIKWAEDIRKLPIKERAEEYIERYKKASPKERIEMEYAVNDFATKRFVEEVEEQSKGMILLMEKAKPAPDMTRKLLRSVLGDLASLIPPPAKEEKPKKPSILDEFLEEE